MRLVTGGSFQGKANFAKALFQKSPDFVDGLYCTQEEALRCELLNHFHELVKRILVIGEDPYLFTEQLCQCNKNITILVNELGCGIVPIDRFDRNYRETVGRLCCILAKQSTEVYRVTCGIGIKIK